MAGATEMQVLALLSALRSSAPLIPAPQNGVFHDQCSTRSQAGCVYLSDERYPNEQARCRLMNSLPRLLAILHSG
jgi:hypothetical protein